MSKTPAKCHNDWFKTQWGVGHGRYPLSKHLLELYGEKILFGLENLQNLLSSKCDKEKVSNNYQTVI